MTAPTQLLAIHGWAGDSRAWEPWAAASRARGWSFSCAERGYGQRPPQQPSWDPQAQRRVLLCHSMGTHLLPDALWPTATAVVLLASFAAFVPAGREGRPVRAALRAMDERLRAGEEQALLTDFLRQAAAPQPATALPPGPLQQGLSAAGRERLRRDLHRLGQIQQLPSCFPENARVLIVEASEDQIVAPASRAQLRASLPAATLWSLAGVGHSLLDPELPSRVLDWIAEALP